MVEVSIAMTAKGYHPKAQWRQLGSERQRFPDVFAARTYLKERYGRCKRVPSYVDLPGGGVRQSGTIYGFRAGDGLGECWLQQDWVALFDVQPIHIAAAHGEANREVV